MPLEIVAKKNIIFLHRFFVRVFFFYPILYVKWSHLKSGIMRNRKEEEKEKKKQNLDTNYE